MSILLLFLLLLHSAAGVSSQDWVPVVKEKKITCDLESTPLQIKTNSMTVGSDADRDDIIYLKMYKDDGGEVGRVVLWLSISRTVELVIGYCTHGTKYLPVKPSTAVNKIWMITKTAEAFTIYCNGMQLLEYKFSESSDSRCVPRWSGDVVGQIKFDSWGKAPDLYSVLSMMCPSITVDNSTNGTWPEQESGTTIEVACKNNYEIIGESTLTCQNDGTWSPSALPKCKKIKSRCRNAGGDVYSEGESYQRRNKRDKRMEICTCLQSGEFECIELVMCQLDKAKATCKVFFPSPTNLPAGEVVKAKKAKVCKLVDGEYGNCEGDLRLRKNSDGSLSFWEIIITPGKYSLVYVDKNEITHWSDAVKVNVL